MVDWVEQAFSGDLNRFVTAYVPTECFTFSEPQNPSIAIAELHEICRLAVLEAQFL